MLPATRHAGGTLLDEIAWLSLESKTPAHQIPPKKRHLPGREHTSK